MNVAYMHIPIYTSIYIFFGNVICLVNYPCNYQTWQIMLLFHEQMYLYTMMY